MLLTGIHLSIASHFCCGELVGVKFSVANQEASCGMNNHSDPLPLGGLLKKQCCVNDLTRLTVDSNYSPSYFKIADLLPKVIQVFDNPLNNTDCSLALRNISVSVADPPGSTPTNTVDLTEICVFRI